MMDLVDIGCHPDPRQHMVDRTPQPDIAVFEDAVRGRHQALDDDGERGNPDHPYWNNHEKKPPHRLNGMRPVGGRHVHEVVAVMHLMKSPQDREQVQGAMRQVACGKIQNHDAGDDLHGHRQPEASRQCRWP